MFFDAIIEPLQKTFACKGCEITAQKKLAFGQILQALGSWGYTTMIRMLYNKDQEVIQQGSGGDTTRIRTLLA